MKSEEGPRKERASWRYEEKRNFKIFVFIITNKNLCKILWGFPCRTLQLRDYIHFKTRAGLNADILYWYVFGFVNFKFGSVSFKLLKRFKSPPFQSIVLLTVMCKALNSLSLKYVHVWPTCVQVLRSIPYRQDHLPDLTRHRL